MVTAAAARRLLPALAGALAACVFAGPAPAADGLRPAVAPNDPSFEHTSLQWPLARPRFLDAWSRTMGDPRTIIAIVDTGVDPATADLQGALLPGYDFVDDDADPSDPHGHGTMMATIAAARIDNGVGIAGGCGACSILPVRVAGSDGFATWAAAARGIVWAADHGARVISISLVGSTTSPGLESAVAYAQGKGALVVAGAGNEGADHPGFPAALPGVISVEASDENDNLYPFSNHGPGVTIAAPGCAAAVAPGNRNTSLCGTSVATPLVAAAAALLFSASPGATAQQVAAALEAGAVRATDSRYGRLDAAAALAALPAETQLQLVSPPTVAGTPARGALLTASTGVWSGGNASFAFRWLRCGPGGCGAIRGATRPTYVVGPADAGRTLEIEVTATTATARLVARSAGTAVPQDSKRRYVRARG